MSEVTGAVNLLFLNSQSGEEDLDLNLEETNTEALFGGSLLFMSNEDLFSTLMIRAKASGGKGTGDTETEKLASVKAQVNSAANIGQANLAINSGTVTVNGNYGVFTLVYNTNTGNMEWRYQIATESFGTSEMRAALDALEDDEIGYDVLGIYGVHGDTESNVQLLTVTINGNTIRPEAPDLIIRLVEDHAKTDFTPEDFGLVESDGISNEFIEIITLPDTGKLEIGSDSNHDASTIYRDIAAGEEISTADISKLRYTPAPNSEEDVSFTYNVIKSERQSEPPGTITIDIEPEDDLPEIVNNNPVAFVGKDPVLITSRMLLWEDVDSPAENIIHKVTMLTKVGKLELKKDWDSNPATPMDWRVLSIDSEFTQADVNAGRLRYVPDPVNSSSTFFNYETFYLSSQTDPANPNNAPVDIKVPLGVETSLLLSFRQSITRGLEGDSDEGQNIVLKDETEAKKVKTNKGKDKVFDGKSSDRISTGLDDDIIDLSSGGADEVIYEFKATADGFIALDGGDEILNFTRGEDQIIFGDEDGNDFLSEINVKFKVTVNFDEVTEGVWKVTGLYFVFLDAVYSSTGALAGGIVKLGFSNPIGLDEFQTLVNDGAQSGDGFENLSGLIIRADALRAVLGMQSVENEQIIENTKPQKLHEIEDQMVNEDDSFVLDIKTFFTDTDVNDDLSYSIRLVDHAGAAILDSQIPDWLNFDDGVMSGTPDNGDVGEFYVEVTAIDQSKETAQSVFKITVNNTNDAPTLELTENIIPEAALTEGDSSSVEAGSFDFYDIDVDNQNEALRFYAKNSGNADQIIAKEAVDDVSEIELNPLTFANNIVEIEGTYGTFTLIRDDTSGLLTVSYELDDTLVQVLVVGQRVYDVLGIYANDGQADSDVKQVVISITGTNNAPTLILEIEDQPINEDSPFTLIVRDNFADVDNEADLTFGAQLVDIAGNLIGDGSLPEWLGFNNGEFSGTPLNDDVGPIYLKVTADDQAGGAVSGTFKIDVANTNDVPTAEDSSIEIFSNHIKTDFSVEDFGFADVDGDSLHAVKIISFSGNGVLKIGSDALHNENTIYRQVANNEIILAADIPKLKYAPTFNSLADAFLNFQVSDGTVFSETPNTLTLDTVSFNEAPVFVHGLGRAEIKIYDFTFRAKVSGPEGDKLKVIFEQSDSATGLSTFFSSDRTTYTVRFNDVSDFGTTNIDFFTIKNGSSTIAHGLTSVLGVRLDNDKIDTPISPTDAEAWEGVYQLSRFSGTPIRILEGNSITLNEEIVPVSDADAHDNEGGRALGSTLFRVNDPINGYVSLNDEEVETFTLNDLRNGRVKFVHDGTDITAPGGADTGFTLTVSDARGASSSQYFRVQIDPVNEAPMVVGTISDQFVAERESFSLDINNIFEDEESEFLTYSASVLRLNGSTANSSLPNWLSLNNGVFSGTPPSDAIGNVYTIRVFARDEHGSVSHNTFQFTVLDQNEAPSFVNALDRAEVVINDFTFRAKVSGPEGDNLKVIFEQSDSATGLSTFFSPDRTTYTVRFNDVSDFGTNNIDFFIIKSGSDTIAHGLTSVLGVRLTNDKIDTPISPTDAEGWIGTYHLTRIAGDVINVVEGGTVTLTEAMFPVTDPDTHDVDQQDRLLGGFTFTVNAMDNGRITINGHEVSSFSLDDLRNGLVIFNHDGTDPRVSGGGDTSFTLTVTDPGGLTSAPQKFWVRVRVDNDAPLFTPQPEQAGDTLGLIGFSGQKISLDEDSTTKFLGGTLAFQDEETSEASLSFYAKSHGGVAHGATEDDSLTSLIENVDTVSEIGSTELLFSNNVATINGKYGVFTLTRSDGDGTLQWHYQAAQDAIDGVPAIGTLQMRTDIQALRGDETAHDVLGVYLSDGNGNSEVLQLVARVTGAWETVTLDNIPYDLIEGDATANTLTGDASNEYLRGFDGADIIIGGAGQDILDGGDGEDRLTGGAGNDLFELRLSDDDSNRDIVLDFTKGEDAIRLNLDQPISPSSLSQLTTEASIRWTNDTHVNTGLSNDDSVFDTIIYNTQGTSNVQDDVILMVLEDFTLDLAVTDFEIY